MTNTSFSGTDALDRFKKRIDYPAIVQAIPDEEKIVVNWQDVLKGVQLAGGDEWKSYENSYAIQGKNHGSVTGFLVNKERNVLFNIHYFTDATNKEVINEALYMTSFTSMMDINYEYLKQGPGDFYIYGSHYLAEFGHDRAICAYRNVIIDVSTAYDDVDVKPVVERLVKIMSDSKVKKELLPSFNLKPTYSSKEIKTGDEFWIGVAFQSSDNYKGYILKLQSEPLPDGLEYLHSDDDKLFFKANRAGSYQFTIWAMDPRTLITKDSNIILDIE